MRRDDVVMTAVPATMVADAAVERMPQQQAPSLHAVPADVAQMDLIFVQGFEGETVIGIDPCELDQPQPLRIDVTAGLPRSGACTTDHIGDTIHYGEVREALRNLMKTHQLQLLEAFAERIAGILLEDFGAHWVRVVVVKPKKFDDVAAVGVAIERRRHAPRHGNGSLLDWLGNGMVPS